MAGKVSEPYSETSQPYVWRQLPTRALDKMVSTLCLVAEANPYENEFEMLAVCLGRRIIVVKLD